MKLFTRSNATQSSIKRTVAQLSNKCNANSHASVFLFSKAPSNDANHPTDHRILPVLKEKKRSDECKLSLLFNLTSNTNLGLREPSVSMTGK